MATEIFNLVSKLNVNFDAFRPIAAFKNNRLYWVYNHLERMVGYAITKQLNRDWAYKLLLGGYLSNTRYTFDWNVVSNARYNDVFNGKIDATPMIWNEEKEAWERGEEEFIDNPIRPSTVDTFIRMVKKLRTGILDITDYDTREKEIYDTKVKIMHIMLHYHNEEKYELLRVVPESSPEAMPEITAETVEEAPQPKAKSKKTKK